MTTRRRMEGEAQQPAAKVQFLADWRESANGSFRRSAPVTIEYDPARLPHCRQQWRGAEVWNIEAAVRVHPRGEIVKGSVLKARREPPEIGLIVAMNPAPFVVVVPADTTRLEMWFHNFSEASSRCDAWDSRFGDNYWFDVGGDPPRSPREPVVPRPGTNMRADLVNVAWHEISKKNEFPRAPGHEGLDLRTLASLVIWVRNLAYAKNVWMDLHVFDQADERIHSQTFTLGYRGSAGGEGDLFAFDGPVYQGSTATPGSASPKPDAGTVQYRVYYEVLGQIYTDGILHQQSLPADAITR